FTRLVPCRLAKEPGVSLNKVSVVFMCNAKDDCIRVYLLDNVDGSNSGFYIRSSIRQHGHQLQERHQDSITSILLETDLNSSPTRAMSRIPSFCIPPNRDRASMFHQRSLHEYHGPPSMRLRGYLSRFIVLAHANNDGFASSRDDREVRPTTPSPSFHLLNPKDEEDVVDMSRLAHLRESLGASVVNLPTWRVILGPRCSYTDHSKGYTGDEAHQRRGAMSEAELTHQALPPLPTMRPKKQITQSSKDDTAGFHVRFR
ncbi:hypothetical protein PROFUN_12795, partial [Planoprotostelium fungivorum]